MFRFTETVYNRPRFIIESTINVTGIVFSSIMKIPFVLIKIWSICVVWEALSGRVMSDKSVPSRSANTPFKAFRALLAEHVTDKRPDAQDDA